MSKKAIILAATRLTVIFILLRLILFACYWVIWFSYDDYRNPIFWIALILFSFWAIVALILAQNPNFLTAGLCPESRRSDDIAEAMVGHLEVAAIRLIGLFFFAQAAIECLEYLLYFFVKYADYGAARFEVVVLPLRTETVAGIFYITAKSVIALWLMAGPCFVQKYLDRIRSAGREWMDQKEREGSK